MCIHLYDILTVTRVIDKKELMLPRFGRRGLKSVYLINIEIQLDMMRKVMDLNSKDDAYPCDCTVMPQY